MVSTSLFTEFQELIHAAKRRAESKADEKRQIQAIAEPVLARIDDVAGMGESLTAYLALGFYGKIQFEDKATIRLILEDGHTGAAAIAIVRAMEAVRIAASARDAWDRLEERAPELLWTAIAFNFQLDDRNTNQTETDGYDD